MNKLTKLAALKLLKEHHEKTAEKIGNEINILSAEVYDDLIDAGLAKITVSAIQEGKLIFSDGADRILTPEIKLRPSVKDNIILFAWLRERNHGALIKETIHHQTLTAWVQQQKEANAPMPPEDAMGVFEQKSVSIRKSRSTRAE
jgi:hypothetical protein